MPGCCPPQAALSADAVHPLFHQAFESTGLNSSAPDRHEVGADAARTGRGWANPAHHFRETAQARRMDWLAIRLPHGNTRLFGRLPFGDAVRLAALVGTDQMSWPEVNAALDAMIKLAIAQLRAAPGEPPTASDAQPVREDARPTGEDEVWARYHAECDAIFANDMNDDAANMWSAEALRTRELRLNRLRDKRDRALATLVRRPDSPPPQRVHTARSGGVSQLSATERDALSKLDASGFVASAAMADAIWTLAAPVAGAIRPSA